MSSIRKLAIISYAFAPSIGGIETVSLLLARGFAQRGFEVTVITNSPNNGSEPEEPFRVVRKPGLLKLLSEIRNADSVLQSNISLNLGWPLWCLFLRKPFLLVHHTPIARPDGSLALQDRLKRWLLWRPRSLTVSRYLAERMPSGTGVICNPYDSATFRLIPGIARDSELLFVGRLVYAKGVDILLRAFQSVAAGRPQTRLSIVGSGPEEAKLKALAAELGVDSKVDFLGSKHGEELAKWMNRHRILVVPSRSHPPEIFGIIALEGIASGCVPVASHLGGLPEAIGNTGVLFEEGNTCELAAVLLRLLEAPEQLDSYRAHAPEHLMQFAPNTVVQAYLEYLAPGRS
jgi:glycosyltransferase involved in cell wall biosynthesis